MKQYYPGVLKPIFLTQTLTVLMLLFLVFKGNGSNNLFTAFPVYLKSPACLVTDLSQTKAIQSNDKTYRVQVCASRFILPDINLLEKQCGQSNLTYEEVDGYFKYTTPSTFNYAAVLKTLHEIKAKPGFEGSFVVAYKGSERVKPPISTQVVVAAAKDLPQPIAVYTLVSKIKNQISIADTSPVADLAPKGNATKKLSKELIESPVYFKAGFTNKFNIPNLVIIILIIFSFGFLVLSLLLIFNVFRKIEKSEESEEIGELYAEHLAVYLKDKSENSPVPELFKEAITDFEKDILISEIITLYSMLPVETGNKIRDLYFKLELDYYSFLKLSNEKWNIQAMGIHELSAMEANNEVDSIGEFINHPHPVPRHEAIAASVKLHSDDPFGFLDRLRVPLTKRDQINAYTILWKQQYAIPDFSRWFDSTNPSVVQFAVEMVSMNRQIEAIEAFDKLLHHSSEEVRESVIRAIGDLFLTVYSARLIQQFDNEHEHLRILILQTMGKLQDSALLNFLSDTVLLNPFMKTRVAAAKALVNIGPQGLARMQTLLLKEDHDITYIYNYIIHS